MQRCSIKAEVLIFARMKVSHQDRFPLNDSLKLGRWRITVLAVQSVIAAILKVYRVKRKHLIPNAVEKWKRRVASRRGVEQKV